MQRLRNHILAIEESLRHENWHSALILSLILPDVCGGLEGKNQGPARYIEWFDVFLGSRYKGFLSGQDCYALRCAVLHEVSDTIESHKAKDVLDKFVFTAQGSHCNKIQQQNEIVPEYHDKVVLQLAVKRLCNDFVAAAKTWLEINQDRSGQCKLGRALEIYKNGVTIGAIKVE